MTDVQKFFLAAGIVAVALYIGKKAKEKKSGFVDEHASDASGVQLPNKAQKAFRPNTWTKVGNNWVWVNSEGELMIDND